jgi:hypothetical protein
MISALHKMHQRVLEARTLLQASVQSSSTPSISLSPASSSRSASPAPSTSSESSTSTHTATPRTPHPEQKKAKSRDVSRAALNGPPHLTPTSSLSRSPSEASSITAKTITPDSANRGSVATGNTLGGYRNNSIPNGQPRSNGISSIPRPPRASPVSPPALRPPTMLVLVRSYIRTLLQSTSKPKLIALFLLFAVFPFVPFFTRMRRQRLVSGQSRTAQQVRARLRGAQGGALVATGVLTRLWDEIISAINDTIRMGGGGLA